MRFYVISQATNLQTLRPTLFHDSPPAVYDAALEHLERLNPHVDIKQLSAGTVLLLPDVPGMSPAEGHVIGGDVFHTLSGEISDGLKAVAQSLRAAAKALDADRSAVESAIDTGAVQGMMGDETLKTQIEAAQARFAAEQKEMEVASGVVENLQKSIATELTALGQLLGFPTERRGPPPPPPA
jgi:hypothetical protein